MLQNLLIILLRYYHFRLSDYCIKKSIVVRKDGDTFDKKNLIFLFSKSSNNLNQIAKQIHIGNKAGIITKDRMNKAIKDIETISALLIKGINDVN
ncbi:plasmid mobilization relaxosome protein MobC [Aliivibrio wodanis]|uniref:plasmid mobilization relaxosome protein MobC n=1 Tax=Aliivibrio wodanis TaxID=80852 RepID=UPI00406C60AE